MRPVKAADLLAELLVDDAAERAGDAADHIADLRADLPGEAERAVERRDDAESFGPAGQRERAARDGPAEFGVLQQLPDRVSRLPERSRGAFASMASRIAVVRPRPARSRPMCASSAAAADCRRAPGVCRARTATGNSSRAARRRKRPRRPVPREAVCAYRNGNAAMRASPARRFPRQCGAKPIDGGRPRISRHAPPRHASR